jgi:hypothetical protein
LLLRWRALPLLAIAPFAAATLPMRELRVCERVPLAGPALERERESTVRIGSDTVLLLPLLLLPLPLPLPPLPPLPPPPPWRSLSADHRPNSERKLRAADGA